MSIILQTDWYVEYVYDCVVISEQAAEIQLTQPYKLVYLLQGKIQTWRETAEATRASRWMVHIS